MEISKSQVARLVLGYLKSENCLSAFNEFLNSSKYLRKHSMLIKNGKYFATRVSGLCLEDFLSEYAQICNIVQGRLEATDYYAESRLHASLVHQLQYLLDKDFRSRTSTPCPPSPTHYPDFTDVVQTSDTEHNYELSTTPTDSLPGNVCDYIIQTGKCKRLRSPKELSTPKTDELEINVSQIISEALLHKEGLPEKLAETINNFRNTVEPSDDSKTETINEVAKELNTTIKMIVQKTEEDPMFDKILDEIIGSKVDNVDTSRTSQDTQWNRMTSGSNTEGTKNLTVYRNSDKNPTTNTVSLTTGRSCQKFEQKTDVIFYEGSFDNYVKNTTASQSSVFVGSTTAGLLMVPPVVTFPGDCPKYYIVNSQPAVASVGPVSIVPSKQPPTIITEQDILKMPTVIINDDTGHKQPNNLPTVPNNFTQLLPKSDKICISSPGSDFLTVFGEENTEVTPKNVGKKRKAHPQVKNAKPVPVIKKPDKKIEPPRKAGDLPSLEQPATPQRKEEPIEDVTPKSTGSHVRNLDFSTPEKETSKCDAKNVENDTKKSLFPNEKEKTKAKTVTATSWDSDLRALTGLTTTESVRTRQPNKCKASEKATDDELEHNAMLLEAALKTPMKHDHGAVGRVVPTTVPSETVQPKSDVVDNDANKDNETMEEVEEEGEPTKDDLSNLGFSLRNCNAAPRFKKKCNLASKAYHKVEPEIVTKVQTNDSDATLVMSPSKLNANKRKLHNDKPETAGGGGVVNKIALDETTTTEICAKSMTTLETPVKESLLLPPKTPGTNASYTPFTKLLEEQLFGVDLTSLATPQMPITPNFPMTPSVDNVSPYYNRPTDYSTSSSYYQPSDTEQNKSLELQMIEECKRLESSKGKNMNLVGNEQVASRNQDAEVKDDVILSDIKSTFNKVVIAKKNLNLIKMRDSSSSSSSSEDEPTSSSSEDSESDAAEDVKSVVNLTPLPVQPNTPYSLRKRYTTPKPAPVSSVGRSSRSGSDKTSIKNIIRSVKAISPSSALATDTKYKTLLSEIDIKRRRTINNLKNESNKIAKEPNKNAKGKNIKPKKATIPRKQMIAPILHEQIAKIFDVPENEITDDDFALHLSTDDEGGGDKPTKTKETNKSSSKKEEGTPSDIEAEQMVRCLKERGIHLLHKKSPKKSETSNPSESPAVDTKITNQYKNKEPNEEIGKTEMATEPPSKDKPINTSLDEIVFDTQHFENVTRTLVYNPGKRSKRIEDFDFKLLEKELKANVYIELLDTEMERIIKCAPFKSLLDIPVTSRRKLIESKPEKTRKENKQDSRKLNSSERTKVAEQLRKEREKSSTDKKPSSKIVKKRRTSSEKDVAPKTGSSNKTVAAEKKPKETSGKAVENATGSAKKHANNSTGSSDKLSGVEKVTKKNHASQSTNVKEENALDDSSCATAAANNPSKDVKTENEKRDADVSKMKTTGRTSTKEDRAKSNRGPETKVQKINLGVIKKKTGSGKVVDGDTIETVEFCAVRTEGNNERGEPVDDDELMNYALIGSQREENSDVGSASPRSTKKRKGSMTSDCCPAEKKTKIENCAELLKKIDVDEFLNTLHGNTNN